MKLKNTPNPKTKIIPIPDEKIEGLPKDIKQIEVDGKIYKVFDYFTQRQDEQYQRALFFLALGVDLSMEKIFNKYSKSKTIYLYVCHE